MNFEYVSGNFWYTGGNITELCSASGEGDDALQKGRLVRVQAEPELGPAQVPIAVPGHGPFLPPPPRRPLGEKCKKCIFEN